MSDLGHAVFNSNQVADFSYLSSWLRTEIYTIWQFNSKQLQDEVMQILEKYHSSKLADEMYHNAYQRYIDEIQDTNDPHANYQVAFYYQNGLGLMKQDFDKALYHYNQAIKQHHHLACYDICTLYDLCKNGHNSSPNQIQKFDKQELIDIKARMLIDALVNGQHYLAWKVLKNNYQRRPLWKAKLDQIRDELDECIGVTTSKVELAEFYNYVGIVECVANADIIDEDSDEELEDEIILNRKSDEEGKTSGQAYDYFQKAATLGDGRGYFNYAHRKLLSNKISMKSNDSPDLSLYQLDYFLKAAKSGHRFGWFGVKMGISVHDRDDIENNKRVQQVLIKTANACGCSDVLSQLAYTYLEPRKGWDYNHHLARKYFEQALTANPSYISQMDYRYDYCPGYIYEKGIGVPVDATKAAHFYSANLIKAKQCPFTMVLLAKLIERNVLSQCQLIHAVRLYQNAFLLFEPLASSYASFRLGRICNKRLLESENGFEHTKAEFYFEIANKLLAAATPCPISLYLQGKFYNEGYVEQRQVAKAMECYEAAVKYYNSSPENRYYAIKAKIKYERINPKNKQELIDAFNYTDEEIQTMWHCKPALVIWSSYIMALRYRSNDMMTKLYDHFYMKFRQQLQRTNNVNAHFQLANYYRCGLGTLKRDPNKSNDHYRKAAELGHPSAYYGLALLIGCEEEGDDTSDYFQVCATKRQFVEIRMEFLLKAAYLGDTCSISYLENHTSQSSHWNVVLNNYIKAREKITHRSKGRKLNSQEMAKLHIEIGILVTIREIVFKQPNLLSVSEIISHYKKGIKLNDPAAYYHLGYLKMKVGDKFFKGDSNKRYNVTTCFLKAAEMGFVAAKLQLASMCMTNKKLTIKESQLQQLLIEAHQYGDPKSTLATALIHFEGQYGFQQNLDKAHSLLEKALVEDHLDQIHSFVSYDAMGFIYEHLSNCTNKYIKARHWYSTYVTTDIANCRGWIELAKLIEKKKVPVASIDDAIKLYQSAIYINDYLSGIAHYRLGKIYSNQNYSKLYNVSRANAHFQFAHRQLQFNLLASNQASCYSCYTLAKMYLRGYGITINVNKANVYYKKVLEISKITGEIGNTYYSNKATKAMRTLTH